MTPIGPYCGRFAPTPSGPLHFGSLVAAVASFLEARVHQGRWLVRMEDIDMPRVVRGADRMILQQLEAFGLHWDGPVLYQSQRLEVYAAALDELARQGLVYGCTCSRRAIAEATPAGVLVYPGTCRNAGHPVAGAACRVRTQDTPIAFCDALLGCMEQDVEAEVGDFVLRRADGIFTYQLAVVVDDAAQGVTHVVRGSDLLDSTPRQIYLQHLLGLPTPAYCHVPVAVNAQGEKLSKQTRAQPITAAQASGLLVRVLAFLGQRPPQTLQAAPVKDIWQWAEAHWQLEVVPAVLQQPAPSGV